MKREKDYRLWDLLGSLLGVSCVDWDDDFAGDGYGDVWGRAPLGEGVFDAYERAPQIKVIDCRRERADARLG